MNPTGGGGDDTKEGAGCGCARRESEDPRMRAQSGDAGCGTG